jgi:tetratricopeptide (TPR) repeat protein
MRLGVAYFKQAIALDSTYAAAYAGLARMYLRLMLSQAATISPRELHALAEEAARKAVSLDDSLTEGHLAVGTALMVRYDLAAAEKELKRAVAIDPTDFRTPMQLARLYTWQERPTDALAEANRAVENEPLSSSAQIEAALQLCENHEYAEGLARMKKLEAIRPPLQRIPSYTAICHAMKGDWPAALAAVRQHRATRSRGILGYVLARAGERQEALSVLADLTNYSLRTNQGAFEVAVVHAGLGDRDKAFEWLDRSKDDLSLSENIMLPLFDDLHRDPRFARLRQWLRR